MTTHIHGAGYGAFRCEEEKGLLTLWARRPVDPSFRFGHFEEGLPIFMAAGFPGKAPVWKIISPLRLGDTPDPIYQFGDPRLPPAVGRYLEHIPQWAWNLATAFSRREAWALMAASLAARDLRRSHPALFLMVLTEPPKKRPGLFSLKRRDILAHMGLPAEESLVRLLARLDLSGVEAPHLLALRKVIKKPALRESLARLPAMPLRLLELFSRHPKYFDTDFFRRELEAFETSKKSGAGMAWRWGEADHSRLGSVLTHERTQTPSIGLPIDWVDRVPSRLLTWRKIEKMALKVGGFAALQRLSKIPTWDKVVELMEAWEQVPDEGLLPPVPNQEPPELVIPFPEPLVPKGGPLVPICDSLALMAEGEAMRHCVGTYTTRILRGDCDIYQVRFGSERATLELRRLKGLPYLGELKSFRNQEVSPGLKAALMAYLAEEAPTACRPPPQKEIKIPKRGKKGRS